MKLLTVLLASVCLALAAGCGPQDPDALIIKKLDPKGNTWYIEDNDGWGGKDITDAVPLTCKTVGRDVATVTLAGRFADAGTVECR